MKNNINNSIELLIKSSNKGFLPSLHLLSLALIKNYGFNIENIYRKLLETSPNLIEEVNNLINEKKLFFKEIFDAYYCYYEQINYLYNYLLEIIPSHDIFVPSQNQTKKDISSEFYEGFYN
ncbi:hypothetical protein M9Y10_001490 [Tritrichomonas musculus]|uniref:Uncharacterized protein n=1 Tax=Tritrichomonas musculus TaxID=1915356 RepID=A0ABR2L779_9EUKA